MTARILVFGAEGATGRRVVQQAVARGHFVRASDRSINDPAALPSGVEAMLRASSLDCTAVRPGWLMDGEATGDAWIGPDVIPQDLIRTRTGDLAALLLDCAARGEWSRATPAIARDEPDHKESSVEVLVEMLS